MLFVLSLDQSTKLSLFPQGEAWSFRSIWSSGGGHLSRVALAHVALFSAGHGSTPMCCKLLAAWERWEKFFLLLFIHTKQNRVALVSQLKQCPHPVYRLIPSLCSSFPEVDLSELLKLDDSQSTVCRTIRLTVWRCGFFSASKCWVLCWASEVSLTLVDRPIEEQSASKGSKDTWRYVELLIQHSLLISRRGKFGCVTFWQTSFSC